MQNQYEEKTTLWEIDEKRQEYLNATFASICKSVYNADGDWERDE